MEHEWSIARKDLFLSFSFLLVNAPHIDPVELQKSLDTGLFAFSCSQAAVFQKDVLAKQIDGMVEGEEREQRWERVLNFIQPACTKAYKEGRIIWRPKDGQMGFLSINRLLEYHGLGHAIRYGRLKEALPYYETQPGGDSFIPSLALEVYDRSLLRLWIV